MIEAAGAELVEQGMGLHGLGALDEAGLAQRFGENFVVFGAVFGEIGVVFLRE
jgi:hypothetical protein